MAAFDAGDLVLLTASGAILLAVSLGVCAHIWSSHPRSHLNSMRTAIAGAIAAWKDGAHDEVDAVASAKVRELRVSSFRQLMQIASFILIPETVKLMMVVVSGVEEREHTVVQDALFLVCHGVASVGLALPAAVTSKTVDLFYGIFALSLTLSVLPWFCKPDVATCYFRDYVLHLAVLNMVQARPPLALASGLALVAAIGSGALVHARPELWEEAGSALVYVGVGIPAFSHVLEASMVGCIRSGLKMQLAEQALGAATALLKSCCDTVFELDQEGLITSPAENLGGMLLRGPGRCLRNVRLADLLPCEEDKAALAAKLRSACPNGVGLAEAIHVQMRDVLNNLVRVELLSFQFRHLDERPRYMVGLRESADAHAAVGPLPGAAVAVGADWVTAAESRAASYGSEGGSSVADSGSAVGPMGQPEARLTVDADCEGVHVVECSEEFAALIGNLGRGALLTSLVQHSTTFRSWVQQATNMAVNARDEPPCSVVLNIDGRRVKARCRMLREEAGGLSELEEPCEFDPRNACLAFSGIKLLARRERLRVSGKGTPVLRASL